MKYFISTEVKGKSFDETIDAVKNELSKEGFGVPSEMNVNEIFKQKLDIDFRKYRILGACNPQYAYKALQAEKGIGVFLPCNVVVQELENGNMEVAAVEPTASMMAVENDNLKGIAEEIKNRLEKVIQNL
jgi:uncharacterized protein (DUF302 family)